MREGTQQRREGGGEVNREKGLFVKRERKWMPPMNIGKEDRVGAALGKFEVMRSGS